MRYSLLSLSVLSVFACNAMAANVTIYGLVDYGFSLSRASGNGEGAADGSMEFQMKSGMRNGSRVGLKGVEDLGNGYSVSFILENQFLADSGELQTSTTFWERESTVSLGTPFGKFTLGRTGQLKSPVGSTALAGTIVNPFGTMMSNFIGGHKFVTTGNYLTVNNTITYASPIFSGWQGFAQYSLANTDEGDYVDADDRYMALATRYRDEALLFTAIIDTINEKGDHSTGDQPVTVNIAVNYDFGFIKPYLYAQWFKNNTINRAGGYMAGTGKYDGAGGVIALQWPAFDGKAKVSVGYMNAVSVNDDVSDLERYSVNIGWDRAITKKTHVYTNLGYAQQDTDEAQLRGTEAVAGLVHYF